MIWPLASASGGSGGRHLLLLLALLDVLSAKVGIGHGHDHQGKATLNQVFKATTIDEKHLFFANSLHSVRIRFEVPGWWWNWSTFCQRRGQLLYFISPWKVLWKPPQFSHVFRSSFGWNFPTLLVNPNAFVLNGKIHHFCKCLFGAKSTWYQHGPEIENFNNKFGNKTFLFSLCAIFSPRWTFIAFKWHPVFFNLLLKNMFFRLKVVLRTNFEN